MGMKILKKLKPNYKNNKKIFAFDVETWQDNKKTELDLHYKHQHFLMGCVVGDNLRKTFWDKKDMADFLLSWSARDSMIFATNLDFDFNMLFSGDKRFKGSLFIPKGGLIHVNRRDKKHSWSFYDTLAYTRASVQKLGNLFGKNKLEAPSWLGQTPKTYQDKIILRDYCMQDALITYKFASYLKDYCNDLGMKMKVTIASTGLDYWRRYHQPMDLFQERREWLDLHYQGSFTGGRTEVFKRGLIQDVYGYDFKSMYPSVCYDGIDGNGSYPNPNSVHRLTNGRISYIMDFEGISKVKIKCPYMYIPLLPYKSTDFKLYFPIGEFEGWFTHIELREALKIGYDIIEIFDTVYYTSTFIPFRDAVSKLYKLRSNYKKQGNNIMTQLVKDQMNSGIFGKFAQRINNKTEMFLIDDIYAEENGMVYVYQYGKKHYLESFVERGEYVYNNIETPMKVPLFIFPILSSYTTSLARIKLWKMLVRYPEEIVYTDTDSLYVTKKCFGHSQSLGKLEFLGKYENALFVKPKQYCLDNIIKLKGVPNRFINGRDHFIRLVNGDSIETERFTKIKESAIRKVPYGSIIKVVKNMSNEDTKRKWLKKFSISEMQDSKPLSIIEGVTELEYENGIKINK